MNPFKMNFFATKDSETKTKQPRMLSKIFEPAEAPLSLFQLPQRKEELKEEDSKPVKTPENKAKSYNYLEKKADDIVQYLKKEIIYKRDLEIKQRFPKGKFIVAFEPSLKEDFYIMRLKECLNPKKQVAWVDFYDLTAQNDECLEFTKDEEGLVHWDNMIALLNIKIKPAEVVHAVKLLKSGDIIKKIHQYMGKNTQKKRQKKEEDKNMEELERESEYSLSLSDKTESIHLISKDKDQADEEDKQEPAKSKKKYFKKRRKTAAEKAAIEEKKRKDAENLERRIHVEVEDSGIRVVKTRFINDTDQEEIVELDPAIKEIRPKKWKFIEREEENKEMKVIKEEIMKLSQDSNLIYLEDSLTTTNRNIIRAALTNNKDLAEL